MPQSMHIRQTLQIRISNLGLDFKWFLTLFSSFTKLSYAFSSADMYFGRFTNIMDSGQTAPLEAV